MTENIQNKKIIITGGGGFIGSHLANALSVDNFVTVVDSELHGDSSKLNSKVEYIKGSAENLCDLINFPNSYDMIFHLGEYSRVELSLAESETCFDNTLRSSYKVFEFVKQYDLKLIYAGSSTRFTENFDGKTLSPYTFAKYSNAELLKCYGLWYGLRFATVYFYNVYGPGESSDDRFGTVVSKFLAAAKTEDKFVSITAPGTQTRNFTHIDDVIEALMLVGLYGEGDGYGIGVLEDYSIIDLAEMVGLKYCISESHPANRISASVHNEKTLELGWKPKRNLKDFINSVVK